jgi:hypothetical protein
MLTDAQLERLRRSKLDRTRQRDKATEDGKRWAAAHASFEQLLDVAEHAKTSNPVPDRLLSYLDGMQDFAYIAKSQNDQRHFVQGAFEVWQAAKDRGL